MRQLPAVQPLMAVNGRLFHRLRTAADPLLPDNIYMSDGSFLIGNSSQPGKDKHHLGLFLVWIR